MAKWTAWPHIGRGSGELQVGRICWDIYSPSEISRRFGITRLEGVPIHPARHMRFHSYVLFMGSVHVIVRRWR